MTIRRRTIAIGLWIALACALALHAPSVSAQRTAQAPVAQPPAVQRLVLLVGRSMAVQYPFDIERVSFTDPEIADGVAVSRRELLINGKKPGTISLLIWGGGRLAAQYEIVVDPATPSLQDRMQTFFPGENIQVTMVGTALVLSGRASSQAVLDRAAEITRASGLGSTVINLLQVGDGDATPELERRLRTLFPGESITVATSGRALILSGQVSDEAIRTKAGDIAAKSAPDSNVVNLIETGIPATSQQVMLQVRFAQVSHSALTKLGVTLFANRTNILARSATQQFLGPDFSDEEQSGLVFSDFLNLFFFSRTEGIGAVIQALRQNGSFESLAEPNLIAYNNKKASFLAGGEFPVPLLGGNGAVSVEWKKFGIGLEFTPQIIGETIHLRVRPEVSAPDFANGVILNNFRIPLLTQRYADTEVELQDGQSFAIAGLLDHVDQNDKAAIPILSRIPIIGKLFQSKNQNDTRQELLVLITARLVQPLNADQLPVLPKIKKDGGGR